MGDGGRRGGGCTGRRGGGKEGECGARGWKGGAGGCGVGVGEWGFVYGGDVCCGKRACIVFEIWGDGGGDWGCEIGLWLVE